MASIDVNEVMAQIRQEREDLVVREFAHRVLNDQGAWSSSYEMVVHLENPIDMDDHRWTVVKVSVEYALEEGEPGDVFYFSGRGLAYKLTKSGTVNQRENGYWRPLPCGAEELIARKLVPQFVLDHLAEQAHANKTK